MYGSKDVIVSPRQWLVLKRGVPHAEVVRFKEAGHFIMLDQPRAFMAYLHAFLEGERLPEVLAEVLET
jgi:pimeloyl-ACP methyl ester carboxylesterase